MCFLKSRADKKLAFLANSVLSTESGQIFKMMSIMVESNLESNNAAIPAALPSGVFLGMAT